ncbi:MAG TPA: metalloregulator ArsR/SmtB family transcription factor [Chloroflexota bacterium]|nr:metalloregulator ArsR/SmtB family transcription factor [Chloroflexota bacterium]
MISILPLFKALADEKRIKIAALTSARPLSVEEIAAAVELTPATVSHHLAILREAGLVEASRVQYYTVYRFTQQPLLDALRTVAEQPAAPDLADDLAEYDRKVLRDYLVDGKLKTIPVQRKKREVILRYLAQQFEPDRHYPEKEVNAILVAFHDDVATLRRELVSGNPPLLVRDKGIYRRT